MRLLIDKISKILYKIDPQGLASMGAPLDEYDSEAKYIFEKISSRANVSITDLTEIVYNVFKKQFGTGTNSKGNKVSWDIPFSGKYRQVAIEIAKLKEK